MLLAPYTADGIDVREAGVRPTRQTVAKHQRASFARLCDAGRITGEMFQAAQEIDAVYTALTHGLWARGVALERQDRSAAWDMPARIAWAYRDRYKPWADRLSARHKQGGPPALEIVIDIVVDGGMLADRDRASHWRHGTAGRILRQALLEYAVMARWASPLDRRG